VPYGLEPPLPAPQAPESSSEPVQADSLEQALLELAGVTVPRSARPSVFEPGVLDEPVMTPRRPSELPASAAPAPPAVETSWPKRP
jgi:hypothetical protein